jgi:hypothetical protein
VRPSAAEGMPVIMILRSMRKYAYVTVSYEGVGCARGPSEISRSRSSFLT